MQYDFEDLQQTDKVGKRLLSRLDALVLDAGLVVRPYSETKDGIDNHT